MDRSGSVGQARWEEIDVQEAATPVTAGTRAAVASRGWLLPYLLILVVAVVELLADSVVVGGFLVLAPLPASRLSNRRSQVIAVGAVTLAAAAALGIFTGKLTGDQLAIRLALITLATLFALVNWGASQREQSALGGPPTPSGWPARWPPASSRRRPTTCSPGRPGRCTRPTRPRSTAARASRW